MTNPVIPAISHSRLQTLLALSFGTTSFNSVYLNAHTPVRIAAHIDVSWHNELCKDKNLWDQWRTGDV